MPQDILDGKYKKIDDAVAEVGFIYRVAMLNVLFYFMAQFQLNKDDNNHKNESQQYTKQQNTIKWSKKNI